MYTYHPWCPFLRNQHIIWNDTLYYGVTINNEFAYVEMCKQHKYNHIKISHICVTDVTDGGDYE